MPVLADALTQLATLSVAGVTTHFSPETLPKALARAHLPALLIVPGELSRPLFARGSEGFRAEAFPDGLRTVMLPVTHMLAVAPVDAGAGPRTHWPAIIALVDAYFAALAANPTLGGTLREPSQVSADAGIIDYGAGRYWGVTLRHRWVLAY